MDMLWVILVGLAAGFIGGLLGVGGGILFVPAFIYLLRDRIPSTQMAIGTSLAVVMAVAIAGTIQHHMGGRINWRIVPCVAIFAIIGSTLGARVSGILGGIVLRRIFAVLLVIVAVKMFFSKPNAPAPGSSEAIGGPSAAETPGSTTPAPAEPGNPPPEPN